MGCDHVRHGGEAQAWKRPAPQIEIKEKVKGKTE